MRGQSQLPMTSQPLACLAAAGGGPPAAALQTLPQDQSVPFPKTACPAAACAAGEGPPATAIQEEERVAAALVHSFEAVDREIMTRCRLEGTKGGATGLVVLRIGARRFGWESWHCCDEPLRSDCL